MNQNRLFHLHYYNSMSSDSLKKKCCIIAMCYAEALLERVLFLFLFHIFQISVLMVLLFSTFARIASIFLEIHIFKPLPL